MIKLKQSPKAFENSEFLTSREARVIRILSEYIEPEKKFKEHNVNHTVIFFGSARISLQDDTAGMAKYYTAAEEFAFKLAALNTELIRETGNEIYICTGGGPGIMEAANKGASRAGYPTIGLNISLPFEQNPNQYISPELNFQFHYFFMRKLWFLYHAKAIAVFPGGYGTFDELFETLTLVQTKKLEKNEFPILLYDKKFWDQLVNFEKMADMGLISHEDLDLFHYFSSPDEGIEIIKPILHNSLKNFNKNSEVKFPI